eukprot:gnl/TRDRNA2_/TRDRNA2_190152_c0_seq1.p1 gnl/TRDRNA2_/TRDRNA2_190152_c0~~gnl/TRDRNA2_/TRDRNA2_190152_c0_seq1.p1  ORF type:complete len:233 (-),score=44.63 gnl/TRDRNA2_/TRDRNA2_190152_c0_seq1:148-846(-)
MANEYVQLESNRVEETPSQRKRAWAVGGILGATAVLALCSWGFRGTDDSDIDYLGAVPLGLQHPGLRAGLVTHPGRIGLQGTQYRSPALNWGNVRQQGSIAWQPSTAAWSSPQQAPRGVQAAAEVSDVQSGEEFDEILAVADNLVVLNVGTTWCGPCKMFAPTYKTMAAEFEKVKFLKLTGDENEQTDKLLKRLGVRSVPVFIFFKDGQEVGDRVVGAKELDVRGAVTKFSE